MTLHRLNALGGDALGGDALAAAQAQARAAEEADLRRRFEAEREKVLAEREADAVYPRTRIMTHDVIIRAPDPGSVVQRRPNRAERRAAARKRGRL